MPGFATVHVGEGLDLGFRDNDRLSTVIAESRWLRSSFPMMSNFQTPN